MFIKEIYFSFAFYGKYVSDLSDSEGDFSREDNREESSESSCNESSENDCDSSVNESDEEMDADQNLGTPRCTVHFQLFFRGRFDDKFYLWPLSDCIVLSVK